jgi:hypothetical protein
MIRMGQGKFRGKRKGLTPGSALTFSYDPEQNLRM